MRMIDADALIAEMSKHSDPVTNNEWLNAVCNAPTVEPKITLNDLLDLLDYNRESTTERIQICRPDADWDDYDELGTCSPILEPLLDAEVNEIGAISEGVTRVDIDWDSVRKAE